MGILKIYNGFGITPTTSYTAAGLDFYCPNLQTLEQKERAMKAFEVSYKKTEDELNKIYNTISIFASSVFGDVVDGQVENILHLFLAVDTELRNLSIETQVDHFIDEYLIYDEKKNVFGVRLKTLDHVMLNSGIKIKLEHENAGIMFNKSGRGTKGYDTRACVVDEDYSGYVHISFSHTKLNLEQGVFYCGDKIQQMIILPIKLIDECEEITEEEYNILQKDSLRGSDAMGSTDIKH